MARSVSRSESLGLAAASQQAAFAGGAPRRLGKGQAEPPVLGSFLDGGDALEDLHGLSQGGRASPRTASRSRGRWMASAGGVASSSRMSSVS